MWMKVTSLSLAALMVVSPARAQPEPCAQVSDLFAESSKSNCMLYVKQKKRRQYLQFNDCSNV